MKDLSKLWIMLYLNLIVFTFQWLFVFVQLSNGHNSGICDTKLIFSIYGRYELLAKLKCKFWKVKLKLCVDIYSSSILTYVSVMNLMPYNGPQNYFQVYFWKFDSLDTWIRTQKKFCNEFTLLRIKNICP